jgi:hypothetical protein
VLERGILLPHPQNDYEVLEERLLEALELPLRRRARILECGHYLGPANEMADDGESESEDEYNVQTGRFKRPERRRWCGTCKGEIKYEDLGPGKVFRVKVYASNGLMKAGAWAACWKEMERVDVEVEPMVETALHRELERLAAFQVEQEERRQRELEEEERARHEEEMRVEEEDSLPPVPQTHVPYEEHHVHQDVMSSPAPNMHASPPSPRQATSPILVARSPSPRLQEPIDTSSARRRREEARLREIYGTSPPPAPEFEHLNDTFPSSTRPEPPTSAFPFEEYEQTHPEPDTAYTASSYVPPPSPRSPSEEAAERRTQRRTGAYQGASLPELVLEAVKVLMRDRKNLAIVVLGFFVVFLATRPGGQGDLGVYRVGMPVAPVLGDEKMVMELAKGEKDQGAQKLETVAAATAVDDVPVLTVSSSLETLIADISTAEVTASISIGQDPEPEAVTVADSQPEVDVSPASDTSFTSVDAASSSSPPEETVTEKKVVRVIETVTETVKVSVTTTESVVAAQETKSTVDTEAKAHVAAETGVDTETDHLTSPAGLGLAVCPLEESDVCYAGQDLMMSI